MSTTLVQEFLNFLDASPTPFHAVESLKTMLVNKGFTELSEQASWQLQARGKHFIIRGASIIAFALSEDFAPDKHALKLIGAHTDSPCLKVKPQPDKSSHSYMQLGVEVYGGVLMNPWFDRDLSIAGQVSYLTTEGQLSSNLINFKRPVAIIPSLAIHLNRSANDKKTVNPQRELNPVLLCGDKHPNFRALLKEQLLQETGASNIAEVLDFNLSFYDTQNAALVGLDDQFISAARLDNLLSCYASVFALANSDSDSTTCMVVCNDHEEVGSRSCVGAMGTMLKDVLARLYPEEQDRQQVLRAALMLSADNAHGIHPNYPNVHDELHGPLINAGPVLKFDANQSYATNDQGSSLVRFLAKSTQEPIPLQSYVTRSDMRCGSTIGPITASNLGLNVVDLGVPTFAMHSIRELAGTQDFLHLVSLFERYFKI